MTKLEIPPTPQKDYTDRGCTKPREEQDIIHQRALVLTRPKYEAVMAPIVAEKKKRAAERTLESELQKKAKSDEKNKAKVQKRRDTTKKKAPAAPSTSQSLSQSTVPAQHVTQSDRKTLVSDSQQLSFTQTTTQENPLADNCFECKVAMSQFDFRPTCAMMFGWVLCATCLVWHCTLCRATRATLHHRECCRMK